MDYLIYISTSVKLMNEAELAQLLEKSRDNNTRNNITGILLYSDGTFIQVLEGELPDIDKTYAIIDKDLRHKNLLVLATGTISTRSFGDWSMGFRSILTEELNQLQGYFNPADKLSVAQKVHGTHESIAIIKSFLENNPV